MRAGKNGRAVQEISAKQKTRNRNLIGIFIGLVVAVLVFISLLIIQKNILDREETIKVCAAAQDIPIGVKIDESNYKTYVKSLEVPVKVLPEGYIVNTDYKVLLDKFVNKTYIENDIITERFLVNYGDMLSAIENPVEVSFSAGGLAASVGGILREGDRINIYQITNSRNTGVVTSKILGEAYITKAFNGSGEAIPTTDKTTPATLINLIIPAEIEADFHEAMYSGSLRLSKILPEA